MWTAYLYGTNQISAVPVNKVELEGNYVSIIFGYPCGQYAVSNGSANIFTLLQININDLPQ